MDSQISAMAGEFLTAGKLFKIGLQASITLGNAKYIDIMVYNEKINKNYNVQVKALRKKNCFPIKRERIIDDHIYVFIVLNDKNAEEEYYIIKGNTILKDIDQFFGSSYKNGKISRVPAINYGAVKQYKDNWDLFFV